MQASLSIPIAMVLLVCASSSAKNEPSYVSVPQYQHLVCDQIEPEVERVSRRAMAVFAKSDGQAAAELARLRAEFEALDRVSAKRNCNAQVAAKGDMSPD